MHNKNSSQTVKAATRRLNRLHSDHVWGWVKSGRTVVIRSGVVRVKK